MSYEAEKELAQEVILKIKEQGLNPYRVIEELDDYADSWEPPNPERVEPKPLPYPDLVFPVTIGSELL